MNDGRDPYVASCCNNNTLCCCCQVDNKAGVGSVALDHVGATELAVRLAGLAGGGGSGFTAGCKPCSEHLGLTPELVQAVVSLLRYTQTAREEFERELSPMQAKVATLAIMHPEVGVKELVDFAAEVGLSLAPTEDPDARSKAETRLGERIRDHLKNGYARLRVSGRAELIAKFGMAVAPTREQAAVMTMAALVLWHLAGLR